MALIETDRLPSLRKDFVEVGWGLQIVNELAMGGEWFTRIVFQTDELPSAEELDIRIETIIQEPRYCHICSTPLRVDNKSGYCSKDYEKAPRRSRRKRKSKSN